MKKILFISESTIKDNSIIETNVDAKIISNIILEVQELELKPILGKDLYFSISNDILSASTISGYTISAENKELLDEYIEPLIIYGTLSYGFVPIHYKFTNKGINVKNDEKAKSVDSKELEYVKNHYDTKFDTYKLRLKNHLEIDLNDEVFISTDTSSDTSGWYIPDQTINLEDYFEALVSKTGFYGGGYYRRF